MGVGARSSLGFEANFARSVSAGDGTLASFEGLGALGALGGGLLIRAFSIAARSEETSGFGSTREAEIGAAYADRTASGRG